MPVRLHRCSNLWLKFGGHPCWRVQTALDAAGVPYEIAQGPLRRSARDDLERRSGQRKYPVIEFEDGSIYREESRDMAATIAAGRIDEKRAAPSPGGSA
jgi:glutathione S-transferase